MTAELVAQIASTGIVGVIAALFIGLYILEKTAHSKSRDAHALELKTAVAEATKLAEANRREAQELLGQINEIREAHALRERASLETIKEFATAHVGAVEELGRVAVTLRRLYERRHQ
jgi:hypothetical protein